MKEIRENAIYNEDCMDTMKAMPDGYIDLVVTSPPYDDMRKYKGYSLNIKDIAKELYRVMAVGGVVVWVVGDETVNGGETLTSFKQAIYFVDECGFKLHDTMLYRKPSLPMNHKRYEQCFEYVFVLVKGKIKTFNGIMVPSNNPPRVRRLLITKESGVMAENKAKRSKIKDQLFRTFPMKLKDNIWEYSVGVNCSKDKIAFDHPAIFPEQLCADHIISWSNPGDLIYDPFGGSGTTAKMAHILNRRWITSEISKEFYEIAKKRIEPYLSQVELF